MKGPRVFVVNEPIARDHDTGQRVSKFDLRPAEKYGRLVHLTPAGNPPSDPAHSIAMMTERLKDFSADDDCLLAIGHPLLICWAAALAARASGGTITILVWRDQTRSYAPVEAELWSREPKENQDAA